MYLPEGVEWNIVSMNVLSRGERKFDVLVDQHKNACLIMSLPKWVAILKWYMQV